LAPARNFLIALIISQFLAIGPQEYQQRRDGNPGQPQGWFKPYSICLRKKGAEETVRHFCAQARLGLLAAAAAVAIAQALAAGVSRQNTPAGRNSGKFGTEKRIIVLVEAGWQWSPPLLALGAA
jgi:hypothetical protein